MEISDLQRNQMFDAFLMISAKASIQSALSLIDESDIKPTEIGASSWSYAVLRSVSVICTTLVIEIHTDPYASRNGSVSLLAAMGRPRPICPKQLKTE